MRDRNTTGQSVATLRKRPQGVKKVASRSKTPPRAQDRLPRVMQWIVAGVLVAVPFHAFFTVWASSAVGHYTALRLWPEMLQLLLVVWLVASGTMVRVWRGLSSLQLAVPIAVYLGLCGVYFVGALLQGDVGVQAASYGLLLSTRCITWFVLVYAAYVGVTRRSLPWGRIVLWPLFAVACFALLQFFVLPEDVLKHFGYAQGSTITPVQTINQDTTTIRAQSFLRGPNPLGAYLLLGIGLLGAATLLRQHKYALMLVSFGALFVSFSRSAWLGVVAVGVVWFALGRGLVRGRRKIFLSLLALIVLLAGLIALVQFSQGAKNALLHVNDNSTAPQTSNEDRLQALSAAAGDVITEPLGRGFGTAGPASVYSHTGEMRNSENYFLGLGQEIGWLGLGLFLVVSYRVAKRLYRNPDRFSRALLATFAGLTLVNLLSYAWADTTLAYLWWGLAAIALATSAQSAKESIRR